MWPILVGVAIIVGIIWIAMLISFFQILTANNTELALRREHSDTLGRTAALEFQALGTRIDQYDKRCKANHEELVRNQIARFDQLQERMGKILNGEDLERLFKPIHDMATCPHCIGTGKLPEAHDAPLVIAINEAFANAGFNFKPRK